jgi:hypothetical protein
LPWRDGVHYPRFYSYDVVSRPHDRGTVQSRHDDNGGDDSIYRIGYGDHIIPFQEAADNRYDITLEWARWFKMAFPEDTKRKIFPIKNALRTPI